MLPDSDYISDMIQKVQRLDPDRFESKKARYENFLKNDFKIWQGEEAMFGWTSRQAYIALSNMLTVAAWMKIDSCAIEGFDREQVERILEEEGVLNGNKFGVCCMAAFGYRKNAQGEKTRRALSDVFEWIG
jgi:nitroreductase